MTTQDPLAAFAPPKAPIDLPPKRSKQPQTVGYLIGAILQLALGSFWTYRGLTGSGRILVLLMGVLLLSLGARAVARYRRSRRTPTDSR